MGSPRERNPEAKRARIVEAALELFLTQGYAETTIDQIAAAAHVGRRTVFSHFATKSAILLDHFAARRVEALERLRARPAGEPPLVSLHAVLRELCDPGIDRRLLQQIRAVLDNEPRIAGGRVSVTNEEFERDLTAVLQERVEDDVRPAELRALTIMATGWFLSAVRIHFRAPERPLQRCYDDVVAWCVDAAAGFRA